MPLHVRAMGRRPAHRPFRRRQRASPSSRDAFDAIAMPRGSWPWPGPAGTSTSMLVEPIDGLADPQRRGSVLMRVVVTGGAGFIGEPRRRAAARPRRRRSSRSSATRRRRRAPRRRWARSWSPTTSSDAGAPPRRTSRPRTRSSTSAGSYRIGITRRRAAGDVGRERRHDRRGSSRPRRRRACRGSSTCRRVNVFGNTRRPDRRRDVPPRPRRGLPQLATTRPSTAPTRSPRRGSRPARRSSSRCPARSSAPTITPRSASSWSRRYRGRLPYIAAAGMGVAPAHVDDLAAGIVAALDRGEVGRVVRARGRLHPVRRGARDRGRGRRADARRASASRTGSCGVDGAASGGLPGMPERAARSSSPRPA